MTVKSYKLGPGTLTLGSVPLDVSAQITNCRIEPTENVTEGDTLDVLSGETLKDDDVVEYAYVLAGTLVQDIDAGGVLDWSWTNKGTEQPFTFVPNTVSAREVTGTIRVVPLVIGGDVKKRNTSDFSLVITDVDGPTFGAAGA